MKRVPVALAAIAVALPGAASATAVQPILKLLTFAPPSVHGVHFKAGERVGVTINDGTTRLVRSLRASRAGSFTIVIGGGAERARCGGTISLVAVGSGGDRAVFRLPEPSCAAAPAGAAATTTTTETTASADSGGTTPPSPSPARATAPSAVPAPVTTTTASTAPPQTATATTPKAVQGSGDYLAPPPPYTT
jgi:hypothetical protein